MRPTALAACLFAAALGGGLATRVLMPAPGPDAAPEGVPRLAAAAIACRCQPQPDASRTAWSCCAGVRLKCRFELRIAAIWQRQ